VKPAWKWPVIFVAVRRVRGDLLLGALCRQATTRSKQHATEAIQKHNEHIEVCNRVIESADSGRPIPAGLQEDWRPEMERLRNELAEQVSANARVSAELAQKTQMVTSLSSRVD